MNEKINNGGPAYPTRGGMMFYIPDEHQKDIKKAIEELDRDYDGMTLRDYFAGQAMITYSTKENRQSLKQNSSIMGVEASAEEIDEAIARACFLMADEMIKQRNS